MRKGTKIPLGPYVYRQRWVPQKDIGDEAYADCDFDARCIRLCDTTDHTRAVENLMHEVVEAINETCELELCHWKITALGLYLAQGLGHLVKKWW